MENKKQPRKVLRHFAGNQIKVLKTIDGAFFSAYDVAEALDAKSPRALVSYTAVAHDTNTVNLYSGLNETVSDKLNVGMMTWGESQDSEYVYFVDHKFLANMLLSDLVEMHKRADFILWLIDTTLELSGLSLKDDTYEKETLNEVNDVGKIKMYATTQIAATFDMSPQKLNKILDEVKVHRKVSGQWILNNEYKDKGLTTQMLVKVDDELKNIHTYWTAKGLEFIINIMEQLGYVKNGRIVEVKQEPKQLSLFDGDE